MTDCDDPVWWTSSPKRPRDDAEDDVGDESTTQKFKLAKIVTPADLELSPAVEAMMKSYVPVSQPIIPAVVNLELDRTSISSSSSSSNSSGSSSATSSGSEQQSAAAPLPAVASQPSQTTVTHTDKYLSYTGVSFSFNTATFTAPPIDCSPFNPWFLSNGIPNFAMISSSSSSSSSLAPSSAAPSSSALPPGASSSLASKQAPVRLSPPSRYDTATKRPRDAQSATSASTGRENMHENTHENGHENGHKNDDRLAKRARTTATVLVPQASILSPLAWREERARADALEALVLGAVTGVAGADGSAAGIGSGNSSGVSAGASGSVGSSSSSNAGGSSSACGSGSGSGSGSSSTPSKRPRRA